MKTLLKVDSWVPVFSGFYETIWNGDSDMEGELENINEKRVENGLSPLENDEDVEYDYDAYQQSVAERVTAWVGKYLKDKGYIHSYKFQKLHSPREYNFANDSVFAQYALDTANVTAINAYLTANKAAFTKYVNDHYTSYAGFMSFHSNDEREWLVDLDKTLADEHKLGAILQFILLNEEGSDVEMDIYEELHGNGTYLYASNYDKLIGGK